eukprot:gene8693-6114_t
MSYHAINWLSSKLGVDIGGVGDAENPASNDSFSGVLSGDSFGFNSDRQGKAKEIAREAKETIKELSSAAQGTVTKYFSKASTYITSKVRSGSDGPNPFAADSSAAFTGENSEIDENGLPVSKNWYYFNPQTNRWDVSQDAPQAVRDEYYQQLAAVEAERSGQAPAVPPPPPPPAGGLPPHPGAGRAGGSIFQCHSSGARVAAPQYAAPSFFGAEPSPPPGAAGGAIPPIYVTPDPLSAPPQQPSSTFAPLSLPLPQSLPQSHPKPDLGAAPTLNAGPYPSAVPLPQFQQPPPPANPGSPGTVRCHPNPLGNFTAKRRAGPSTSAVTGSTRPLTPSLPPPSNLPTRFPPPTSDAAPSMAQQTQQPGGAGGAGRVSPPPLPAPSSPTPQRQGLAPSRESMGGPTEAPKLPPSNTQFTSAPPSSSAGAMDFGAPLNARDPLAPSLPPPSGLGAPLFSVVTTDAVGHGAPVSQPPSAGNLETTAPAPSLPPPANVALQRQKYVPERESLGGAEEAAGLPPPGTQMNAHMSNEQHMPTRMSTEMPTQLNTGDPFAPSLPAPSSLTPPRFAPPPTSDAAPSMAQQTQQPGGAGGAGRVSTPPLPAPSSPTPQRQGLAPSRESMGGPAEAPKLPPSNTQFTSAPPSSSAGAMGFGAPLNARDPLAPSLPPPSGLGAPRFSVVTTDAVGHGAPVSQPPSAGNLETTAPAPSLPPPANVALQRQKYVPERESFVQERESLGGAGEAAGLPPPGTQMNAHMSNEQHMPTRMSTEMPTQLNTGDPFAPSLPAPSSLTPPRFAPPPTSDAAPSMAQQTQQPGGAGGAGRVSPPPLPAPSSLTPQRQGLAPSRESMGGPTEAPKLPPSNTQFTSAPPSSSAGAMGFGAPLNARDPLAPSLPPPSGLGAPLFSVVTTDAVGHGAPVSQPPSAGNLETTAPAPSLPPPANVALQRQKYVPERESFVQERESLGGAGEAAGLPPPGTQMNAHMSNEQHMPTRMSTEMPTQLNTGDPFAPSLPAPSSLTPPRHSFSERYDRPQDDQPQTATTILAPLAPRRVIARSPAAPRRRCGRRTGLSAPRVAHRSIESAPQHADAWARWPVCAAPADEIRSPPAAAAAAAGLHSVCTRITVGRQNRAAHHLLNHYTTKESGTRWTLTLSSMAAIDSLCVHQLWRPNVADVLLLPSLLGHDVR